ncbi:LAMI_0D07162g1_1 [Lachancea mirantina]|uniref:LAMI_0D07162g1_1 n=1 Tax=Lachancea mirantina TaxID=1230905 RepID=A0A1G4JC84_9SACH|nr:LAMI_0D07162g1_1 [Lachancea mirantina]
MSYQQHQPQLSVNSVQSLVEPTTPPLGQMSNRQNHQRAQSLDLSGFNQFIAGNSPMMPMSLSPSTPSAIGPMGLGCSLGGIPGAISIPQSLSSSFGAPPNTTDIPNPSLPAATATVTNSGPNGRSKFGSMPLISELDLSSGPNQPLAAADLAHSNSRVSLPLRTVSGSTTSSSISTGNSLANSIMNTESGNASSGLAPVELSLIPLEDLDYVKLATDQFGCRFLQKKLENAQESQTVRDIMYQQLQPFFLDLILDPFGNYLVQKLCEYLTSDQKTKLIQSIYPNVFQISVNQYGTRSLQKIIDSVDTEAQIDMIILGFSKQYTSIEQVVVLINDLNGNHVVQKCIFKFPPSKFDFIIDAIVENNNIINISTHKHGCCVLQKLLSVCTLQQIFKISVRIVQFLSGLINDQFGNYIIQFLLDIKELDFYLLREIFDRLSTELCQLSCLKFSSNVVEKFIKKLFAIVQGFVNSKTPKGIDDVTSTAMSILLTTVDIFTVNLNVLIRDNFGNYALQTMLDAKNYSHFLEYPQRAYVARSVECLRFSQEFALKIGNLVILTKELLPSIKTTSYAKKIKMKVKTYAELTGIAFTDLSPKKTSNNANPNAYQSNYHRKQHSRNLSLPANAFRHRRMSSSTSMSNGMKPPYSVQSYTPSINGYGVMDNAVAQQGSSPYSNTPTRALSTRRQGPQRYYNEHNKSDNSIVTQPPLAMNNSYYAVPYVTGAQSTNALRESQPSQLQGPPQPNPSSQYVGFTSLPTLGSASEGPQGTMNNQNIYDLGFDFIPH